MLTTMLGEHLGTIHKENSMSRNPNERIYRFGYCADGTLCESPDSKSGPASKPVAKIGAAIAASFYVRNAHRCHSFEFTRSPTTPFGYWRVDDEGEPIAESFMICGILHATAVESGSLSGWRCHYEELPAPVPGTVGNGGPERDNSREAVKARIRERKKARKKAAREARS